jgi:hypothetical protein
MSLTNPVGLEVSGFQKYLLLAQETSWGVNPTSPVWIYVPYTEYGVMAKPQVFAPQLFTGLYQARESRITHTMLDGPLTVPFYGYQTASKSIAEYLIRWAWYRTISPIYTDSYVAQLFENALDNKQHNGLRITQFTISGDNQNGIINFQATLMGSLETGGVTMGAVIPVSTPQPAAFLYKDTTLTLNDGGGAVTFFPRSFSLTVNNNMTPETTNSQWPTLLHAGVRNVQLSFSLFKNSNYWDIFNRATGSQNITATLLLKGIHEGTGGSGTFSTVQADFARLSFVNAATAGDLNALLQQQLQFTALKNDTSADELVFTFGLA